MSIHKAFLLAGLCGVLALHGCGQRDEDQTPAERAADAIEDAGDQAEDAAEGAADAMRDQADQD